MPEAPTSSGEGEPLSSAAALRDRHSTDAVAALFGVTPQQVRKWVRDGCPREARNCFRLVEVIAWRESRRNRREAAVEAVEDKRAELVTEQAEGQRIRNQVRRGELEPVSASIHLLTTFLTEGIAILAAAPQELATEPEERARLTELTDGIRAYFARQLEHGGDGYRRRSARRATAAESSRGRVGRPAEVASRR